MKVTQKIFAVALLLSLMLLIAPAMAQDNMTFEQSNLQEESAETDIEQSTDDDETLNEHDVAQSNGLFSEISDKIRTSHPGEAIFLGGRTYDGQGSEIIVDVDGLTIMGGSDWNDPSYSTLDARGLSRIFNIKSSGITIKNIKLINGNSTENGGAIYWKSGSGSIYDCIFENNNAFIGGAVYLHDADCGIVGSNFTGNSAEEGGAVSFIGNSQNSLVDICNFNNNEARSWGGAIKNAVENLKIEKSNFTGNYAAFNGGGSINSDGKNLSVSNCIFRNSRADKDGGAIRSTRKLTINESEFYNNTSRNGGAIYLTSFAGDCIIFNSRFVNNSARIEGGAIDSYSTINIQKNYFRDNHDSNLGGNIVCVGSGTIISDNEFDNWNSPSSGIFTRNVDGITFENNSFTTPSPGIVYYIIDFSPNIFGLPASIIQIPVSVHDNFGNPVQGLSIYLDYDGKVQQRTLENGSAIFDVSLPVGPTSVDALIRFDGLKENISIGILNRFIEASQPDNLTDNVFVRTVSSPSGKIIININGINYEAEISNNLATVEIRGLANGMYPALIVNVDDEGNMRYSDVIVVKVRHAEVPPVYKISSNRDVNVAYSGSGAYKMLITENGKAVGAGEKVMISFNGKTVTVKTDARGYATFAINANLKPSTYTIKATYKGVSVSNKVKITQIIKASDKKVKKSAKATKVKISLNKVNGKYLVSKTLKIKFDGKTYNVKTNKKGVGTWKIKKSMLKKFSIGKKVKYTVTYGKDTLTKKLTIKK